MKYPLLLELITRPIYWSMLINLPFLVTSLQTKGSRTEEDAASDGESCSVGAGREVAERTLLEDVITLQKVITGKHYSYASQIASSIPYYLLMASR